jgi:hypothetical protein
MMLAFRLGRTGPAAPKARKGGQPAGFAWPSRCNRVSAVPLYASLPTPTPPVKRYFARHVSRRFPTACVCPLPIVRPPIAPPRPATVLPDNRTARRAAGSAARPERLDCPVESVSQGAPLPSPAGRPDHCQNAGADRRRQHGPRSNQVSQIVVNRAEVGHERCALRCTVRGTAVFFGKFGACNLIANPPPWLRLLPALLFDSWAEEFAATARTSQSLIRFEPGLVTIRART